MDRSNGNMFETGLENGSAKIVCNMMKAYNGDNSAIEGAGAAEPLIPHEKFQSSSQCNDFHQENGNEMTYHRRNSNKDETAPHHEMEEGKQEAGSIHDNGEVFYDAIPVDSEDFLTPSIQEQNDEDNVQLPIDDRNKISAIHANLKQNAIFLQQYETMRASIHLERIEEELKLKEKQTPTQDTKEGWTSSVPIHISEFIKKPIQWLNAFNFSEKAKPKKKKSHEIGLCGSSCEVAVKR